MQIFRKITIHSDGRVHLFKSVKEIEDFINEMNAELEQGQKNYDQLWDMYSELKSEYLKLLEDHNKKE